MSFISSVNSPQLPDIWRVLKKASYCPIFRMKNNADCSILWASLETLIITMLGWKYACTKTKLQKLTLRYKSRKIHSFIMIYKLLLSFSSFFFLFIPLNTDISWFLSMHYYNATAKQKNQCTASQAKNVKI